MLVPDEAEGQEGLRRAVSCWGACTYRFPEVHLRGRDFVAVPALRILDPLRALEVLDSGGAVHPGGGVGSSSSHLPGVACSKSESRMLLTEDCVDAE
jgi:hypothetical protein